MYDEMLKIVKQSLESESIKNKGVLTKKIATEVWAVAVTRIESIKAELEAGLKSAVDDMEWE